jgi:hypothetical protein
MAPFRQVYVPKDKFGIGIEDADAAAARLKQV